MSTMKYPYFVFKKPTDKLEATGFSSKEDISRWIWKTNNKDKLLIVKCYITGEQLDPSYLLTFIDHKPNTVNLDAIVYGDLQKCFVRDINDAYRNLHNFNYQGDFYYLSAEADYDNKMNPYIKIQHVRWED